MNRSAIKPKEGACEVDGCGYFGVLIAKKCRTHYWQHRASLKKDSSANRLKIAEKKERQNDLTEWFAKQVAQIPTYCEECGVNLGGWRQVMPKAIIAHILPKRTTFGGFPSVAIHPENRMFFCPDCHNRYDNRGWSYAPTMKSYPLLVERLGKFIGDLTSQEFNRLPEHLQITTWRKTKGE